jgi:hypothetical protein
MTDFTGKDNYGKPKSEYVERISTMTDEELAKETESKIWLSAYAANNPRSDYHWHTDALYAECQKRDPSGATYDKAWKKAAAK